MKVAIVGAREFPVIPAGRHIFDWLAETIPKHTTIYTRGSKGFDAYLAEGARFMGYTVIEMKGSGGADNYLRDVKLVAAVEVVHAFFDMDHVGEGGTQHVIDKALDAGIPSYSYIWDGRQLLNIGSDDGEGVPGRDEEAPASPAQAAGPSTPESAGKGSKGPPVWPDERGRGDLPF